MPEYNEESIKKDSLDKKLKVLSAVAHELNECGIVWAVGASALLYLKNKTDHFNDIDIMVLEDDIDKLKEVLLKMGKLSPSTPAKQYRTRHFLEFTIDGIDIDVMAGFVIVQEGKEYDCSLQREQIAEYIRINGEKIPLQSIADWRRYYNLMGRPEKVEMIDTPYF